MTTYFFLCQNGKNKIGYMTAASQIFFSTDYLKAAKGITNKTSKEQESVSKVKKVPESLQKVKKL